MYPMMTMTSGATETVTIEPVLGTELYQVVRRTPGRVVRSRAWTLARCKRIAKGLTAR